MLYCHSGETVIFDHNMVTIWLNLTSMHIPAPPIRMSIYLIMMF